MGTTPNVMAFVKFTLLGTELDAGFAKDDAGTHIFVYQDVSSPNEGVDIDKLISDIHELLGDKVEAKEITDKLAPLGKNDAIDVTKIRFVLSTVYLDIRIPASGTRTVEYALRLDVLAKGLIKENIDVINIDRLTLAVWNTKNEKVQKQLGLTAP